MERALQRLRDQARAKAAMRMRAHARVRAKLQAERAAARGGRAPAAIVAPAAQRGFATNWFPKVPSLTGWLKLPWFAPKANIWIAPGQVRVVANHLKLKSRGSLERTIGAGEGGSTWQGALAKLAELLEDGALAGIQAHVTLSNHLVRYAVVPWSEAILDDDERRAAAHGTFKLIYGDAAEHWVISLYEQGAGRPLVAAAIDRDLQNGLATLAATNRIRLASVQPCLAWSFNLSRARIPRRDAWFACVENDHICIGYLRRGAWELIRSRRAKGQLAGQLVPMLEQARVADGVQRPAGQLYLFAPGHDRLVLPKSVAWSVVNLRTDGKGVR